MLTIFCTELENFVCSPAPRDQYLVPASPSPRLGLGVAGYAVIELNVNAVTDTTYGMYDAIIRLKRYALLLQQQLNGLLTKPDKSWVKVIRVGLKVIRLLRVIVSSVSHQ
jgi:hypothetical protein